MSQNQMLKTCATTMRFGHPHFCRQLIAACEMMDGCGTGYIRRPGRCVRARARAACPPRCAHTRERAFGCRVRHRRAHRVLSLIRLAQIRIRLAQIWPKVSLKIRIAKTLRYREDPRPGFLVRRLAQIWPKVSLKIRIAKTLRYREDPRPGFVVRCSGSRKTW